MLCTLMSTSAITCYSIQDGGVESPIFPAKGLPQGRERVAFCASCWARRELLGTALRAVRYTGAEQLGAQEGLNPRRWPRIRANKTQTQIQKTDAPRETQTIIAKCRQVYVLREILPSLIRLGKVFF